MSKCDIFICIMKHVDICITQWTAIFQMTNMLQNHACVEDTRGTSCLNAPEQGKHTTGSGPSVQPTSEIPLVEFWCSPTDQGLRPVKASSLPPSAGVTLDSLRIVQLKQLTVWNWMQRQKLRIQLSSVKSDKAISKKCKTMLLSSLNLFLKIDTLNEIVIYVNI